jgi:hypothetical protein
MKWHRSTLVHRLFLPEPLPNAAAPAGKMDVQC